VDRVTRKELKTDKFAQEVGHAAEYVGHHRKQFIWYGVVAVAVVLVVVAALYYRRTQRAVRQADLGAALRLQQAEIGPGSNPLIATFPNLSEKQKAVTNALNNVINKHSGSDEAAVAQYLMGANAADTGRTADAEKAFRQVIDSGSEDYASLAKLSLAQLYEAQGKTAEAEKLLQSLINAPTVLVSKEQATIALARLYANTKTAEARKLLEPLRTQSGAVSRAALTALSELPK
jgi:predicted negative regulator of RcsB-dependent stress response